MIARVLVANRGEIAVRVITACHRLGIEAVVVHSEPDADSMAVELADGAVALPGSSAADTYLDIDRIVGAAVESGCDAVHPGYGFLAERADFASAVADATLTWIGPSAPVIAMMGDKLAARQVARDAGVAPVPGAMFAVDEPDAVRQFGDELGWPLAVKAVHGGGGRGMRVVAGPGEVAELLAAAQRESQSSFGRPDVYVERFLARPRHIEVQIVADHHGGLVVVGDRDCSIQRRYQKLIEEAPAPQLPDAVRTGLAEAASRLARAVGYTNAGTVEFLVEGDNLFFLEMNTRIQVEHPVTELVSGVDLVAEQILVAGGAPLSFGPGDVGPRGAAIEVRINAEDTTDGRFLPVPGTLHRFQLPTGDHVRVDTGYRAGDEIPAAYDNLIAKISVWGADRDEARRRAIDALGAARRRRGADDCSDRRRRAGRRGLPRRRPLDELARRPARKAAGGRRGARAGAVVPHPPFRRHRGRGHRPEHRAHPFQRTSTRSGAAGAAHQPGWRRRAGDRTDARHGDDDRRGGR